MVELIIREHAGEALGWCLDFPSFWCNNTKIAQVMDDRESTGWVDAHPNLGLKPRPPF